MLSFSTSLYLFLGLEAKDGSTVKVSILLELTDLCNSGNVSPEADSHHW
ncbi:hypothetical protein [Desulforamulus aquiferis]|uniref:Uncharacterized protein n=1 Tax=Desulforamulus aquiferis TaxID=1397668 RepID=A0AAW7Z995_9FIRM|nr:hypothetical protein [Desulforamulus aquiferis]MDO7785863.1 hypothetical protein [Desulforamulus aquiferis]